MNFFNKRIFLFIFLLLTGFILGAEASDLVFKKVETPKNTEEEKLKKHFQSLSSSLGGIPSFPALNGQIQLSLADAGEPSREEREGQR